MNYIKILVFPLSILLMTNCEKKDEFELNFGEPQTGFVIDSVYQTEMNGMLYVQFEANSTAAFLRVLADDNQHPETEVSKVSPWGSTTLALKQGTYWKVEKHPDYQPSYLPITDTLIRWTPIY